MNNTWPDETLPQSKCPECGSEIDPASPMPGPGDITLCLRCAALLTFDDQLRARPLNADEMAIIRKDPKLAAEVDLITSAIRQVKKMHAARQN